MFHGLLSFGFRIEPYWALLGPIRGST